MIFERFKISIMQNTAAAISASELTAEPVTEKKVDMAWQLFTSLEDQVLVADRKVQAVFGLNAFLVAAISFQNQQSLHHLLQLNFQIAIIFDLLLKGAFLGCVCMATWSAIKALTPRFKSKKKSMTAKRSSLFFFGDIHSRTFNDFSSAFKNLSNEEAINEILADALSISGILMIKYKMLHRSTVFLSLALLIWIFIQINKFLS